MGRSDRSTLTCGWRAVNVLSTSGTKAALALGGIAAQHHVAPDHAQDGVDLRLPAAELGQDRAGVRQEGLADVGQHDGPVRAVEQARAEGLLQRGEVRADAGLRPVDAVGGCAEPAAVDDGDEGLQPVEVVDASHALFLQGGR